MEERSLDRIANALEKIVDLMEAEDARRRRRTINELKEVRELNKTALKDKKKQRYTNPATNKKTDQE